jgi:hypothetical protein
VSADLDTLAARLTRALEARDAAEARAAHWAAVVDEKCAALDRAWEHFEADKRGDRQNALTVLSAYRADLLSHGGQLAPYAVVERCIELLRREWGMEAET